MLQKLPQMLAAAQNTNVPASPPAVAVIKTEKSTEFSNPSSPIDISSSQNSD